MYIYRRNIYIYRYICICVYEYEYEYEYVFKVNLKRLNIAALEYRNYDKR